MAIFYVINYFLYNFIIRDYNSNNTLFYNKSLQYGKEKLFIYCHFFFKQDMKKIERVFIVRKL